MTRPALLPSGESLLNELVLMDYLQIERVPFDDPRRGPYWNLFEIWYQRDHGYYPPYLYSEGGAKFWHLTTESARMGFIALIHHGVFGSGRLAPYVQDLSQLAHDDGLGDMLFGNELAKLNAAFLPQIDEPEVRHVLLAQSHGATHRHGGVYCPSCNAAAATLHKATNGPRIDRMLGEMSDAQRLYALNRIGFGAHMKAFKAASAAWLVPTKDGLLISEPYLLDGLPDA